MRGFWMKDEDGDTVHINGDPNMPEETKHALLGVMKAFKEQEMRRRKAFDHLWGNMVAANEQTMPKELAWWWFEAGCDWEEQKKIAGTTFGEFKKTLKEQA